MSEKDWRSLSQVRVRMPSKIDGGWCYFCQNEHTRFGDDVVLVENPRWSNKKWGAYECYVEWLERESLWRTYFLATPQSPWAVKIGRSPNPERRAWVVGCPLVAYINEDIESELHKQFADWRIRRSGYSYAGGSEWFVLVDEILEVVRGADCLYPELDVHGWLEDGQKGVDKELYRRAQRLAARRYGCEVEFDRGYATLSVPELPGCVAKTLAGYLFSYAPLEQARINYIYSLLVRGLEVPAPAEGAAA